MSPRFWKRGIPASRPGPAVADILFGDTNPSGKLPATFPRAVGQEPIFYNQLPTGRPADDIDLTHPPTGEDKYFSRLHRRNQRAALSLSASAYLTPRSLTPR